MESRTLLQKRRRTSDGETGGKQQEIRPAGSPEVDVLQLRLGRRRLGLVFLGCLQPVDGGPDVSRPRVPLLSGTSLQEVIHAELGVQLQHQLLGRRRTLHSSGEEDKEENLRR